MHVQGHSSGCADEENALALHEEERLSSQEKRKAFVSFFKNPLDVVRGKSLRLVNIKTKYIRSVTKHFQLIKTILSIRGRAYQIEVVINLLHLFC